MATTDQALLDVIERIREPARRAGFARERGGLVRGRAWAELSGRLSDGSWCELRLHHTDRERKMQAGLLIYRPLAQGGRTEVVGDVAVPYHLNANEAVGGIADAATIWLETLTSD